MREGVCVLHPPGPFTSAAGSVSSGPLQPRLLGQLPPPTTLHDLSSEIVRQAS